ncbi:MAG: hypothetical protein V3R94_04845 [Acidobacteriota bacterium]
MSIVTNASLFFLAVDPLHLPVFPAIQHTVPLRFPLKSVVVLSIHPDNPIF